MDFDWGHDVPVHLVGIHLAEVGRSFRLARFAYDIGETRKHERDRAVVGSYALERMPNVALFEVPNAISLSLIHELESATDAGGGRNIDGQ